MKHIRWLTPVFLLIIVKIIVLLDINTLMLEPSDGVLRSPHGLSIYPVSLTEYTNIPYFSTGSMQKRLISKAEWIATVSPPFALSAIFILTSLFLYLLVRLKTLEKVYIHLALIIALITILFMDFVSGKRFISLFYFLCLYVVVPFISFSRALLGLKVSYFFTLISAGALILLLLRVYPHNAQEEKEFLISMAALHGLAFIYFLIILFRSIASPSKNLKKPGLHHLMAVVLLLSTGFVPLTYIITGFSINAMSVSQNAIIFLPALFPMLFFIASTRFGLVSLDVPVSSNFFRMSYFLFFSLLYWFTIGYHILQIPYTESEKNHFILIALFLFLFDPARTIFYSYFGKIFITRRDLLGEYLKQAASSINNPRQITPFLDHIIKTVRDALQVHWVKMYFSDEIFGDWLPAHKHVHLLPGEHPVWLQIQRWKRAQTYPYFTQAAVGPIRDLLQNSGGFILVSMQKHKMVLSISDKTSGEPVLSEDIRFLRNVMRHTEPLIENYRLLQTRVQLKRKEKELELASRIQRKIIPTHKSYPGIDFYSLFSASEKVTGDYIDMIEPEPGRYRIFLGDVSGHGLGSAYLMSVVRAYIRGSSLIMKAPLSTVLEGLNSFLTESYRGSDFMTLFAIELVRTPDGFLLKYINAGQHQAVIVYPDTLQAVPVGDSQRVLGVIKTEYAEHSLDIRRPCRFYLYSDGAFEIFIDKGKILGEKKLQEWILESVQMEPNEQLKYIVTKVKAEVIDKEEIDDISILCLDLKI